MKDLLSQRVNIVKNSQLNKIQSIVLYLGNTCNFDCVYCDRGYIENLGGQNLTRSTSDEMREFIEWVERQPNEIKQLSFHGGEPLLFVIRMKEIMEWAYPILIRNGWKMSITTNGSLIKKNEDFFKEYADVLYVTISYDFMHQAHNREEFDVVEMSEVLNSNKVQWQWQCVLPIDRPDSFSFENIASIVRTCYKTRCRSINLIPLRHKRGKDKFTVIIDDIDLEQFLDAFLQFIQILYIKKISIYIDGCYTRVDKAYFSEHNKLILSPDGFIYPEFDFLEYKTEHARIGNWKLKQIWRNQGDHGRVLPNCMDCDKRPSCGLKYLYFMFGEEPTGACKSFYTYIDLAIMHITRLREKQNLLEWVGIEEEFHIEE